MTVIAAVIPAYRVTGQILGVISGIGKEVSKIYVVDDACPDNSGDFVEKNAKDKRVKVIRHQENQGVGGAVITGYRAALEAGAAAATVPTATSTATVDRVFFIVLSMAVALLTWPPARWRRAGRRECGWCRPAA